MKGDINSLLPELTGAIKDAVNMQSKFKTDFDNHQAKYLFERKAEAIQLGIDTATAVVLLAQEGKQVTDGLRIQLAANKVYAYVGDRDFIRMFEDLTNISGGIYSHESITDLLSDLVVRGAELLTGKPPYGIYVFDKTNCPYSCDIGKSEARETEAGPQVPKTPNRNITNHAQLAVLIANIEKIMGHATPEQRAELSLHIQNFINNSAC